LRQDNVQKKINNAWWLFLTIILIYISVMVLTAVLDSKNIGMSTTWSLIVSELILLLPALIFCLKGNLSFSEDLGFKKIKISTVLVTVLLGFFVNPVASFVNILSQFFVSNTMTQASDALTDGSTLVILFLSGIYAPVVEELVFRGVLDNRFGKYATPMKAALVSSLAFALMHLNVNQATYAFVLGFIFAIVNRASGSVITSMIIHIVVNTSNMALLFLSQSVMSSQNQNLASAAEEARANTTMMVIMAIVYFVLAVVFGSLGALLVHLIAKLEGRTDKLKAMFKKTVSEEVKDEASKEKICEASESEAVADKALENTEETQTQEINVDEVKAKVLINVPAIISIAVCLFIIFAFEPLINLLGL